MAYKIIPLLVALLLAWSLPAQSSRVEVQVPEAQSGAAFLELEGFIIEDADLQRNTVEILLPDTDIPRLESYGYPVQVLERSRPLRDWLSAQPDNFDTRYYTYSETNQELLNFQNAYPALAQRVNITTLTNTGNTHDGRQIYALKISDNVTQDEKEPAVLIIGNLHAREIATPAAMIDIMDHLLSQYGIDNQVTQWVNENEIWIAACWNPDGLTHAWNVDMWWRKNRRNNGGGVYGVDLNRNYPFKWATCGSYSTSPSSDVYVGPSPGSEPETKTMLAFGRMKRFAKVIDEHQYGQEVLYPYACGNLPFAAQTKVWEVRDELANAASYATRLPSSGGEYFEWQYNEIGALSYLLELDRTFFPSWTQAQAEFNRVRPAVRALLAKPIPLQGCVYDAWDGSPVQDANIAASGVNWLEGELRRSAPNGFYFYWVGNGTRTFTFSKSGYANESFLQNITGTGTERDVYMQPTNRPYLTLEGTPQVGSQVRWRINNAVGHNGRQFTVWASRSGGGPFVPGIPISGGLRVPLISDNITTKAMSISQMTGNISGNTGTTTFLNVSPKVSGLTLWTAAVIRSGSTNFDVTAAISFQVP